ncbi:MAG: SDR family NAD(P)-dependent oxidoreductase, partial [Solirubrobacteraceae bacterium]
EGGWLFTGRLSLESHAWLGDHAVTGVVLLPGTAFLELALHAGGRVGCARVRELALEAPLVLGGGGVQLQVLVGEVDEEGCRPVAVYSRPEGPAREDGLPGGASWVRHATGTLVDGARAAGAELDGRGAVAGFGEVDGLGAVAGFAEVSGGGPVGGVWPPEGAEALDVEGLYEGLAERGYEYGPAFRGLEAAWRRGGEVFAEVALPEGDVERAEGFGVHPALLDAALHATGLGVSEGDGGGVEGRGDGVRLPFAWEGVELHAVGASSLRVRVSGVGRDTLSLVAVDEGGGLVATVRSLTLRPVAAGQLGSARKGDGDSLFSVEWTPVAPAAVSGGGGLVVLGSQQEGGVGEALRAVGVECGAHADLGELRQAVEGGESLPRVVLVDGGGLGGRSAAGGGLAGGFGGGSARESPAVEGEAGVPGMVAEGVARVLGLLQAWLGDERFAGSRLAVVTRGAAAARAGEGVSDLVGGGVWGLVRSAQAESPGRFVLVDVDGEESSWRALASALGSEEPQMAVREGSALAARLVRAGFDGGLAIPDGAAGWRLDAGGGGALEELAVVECPEAARALADGEVRVEVRAAGLNFREVMIALGMRPEEGLVGCEGAGVVLEVGPGVEELAPGDRVMGLLDGSFGSIAVADARLLVRVPAGWSFVRAASVPVAFLTAYYGLVDLAGVRAGERLVVHAAAGGVGMAAVQLAGHLGVEVYGTASPGKWGVLASLGLDEAHRASSRSLEFGERFMWATEGRGVDVVLNSLAGEFVDVSLGLLSRGGRFIEMGKTDIRAPEAVAEERPGVAYRAFDLLSVDPERIREMLAELLELFERGVLKALPVKAWDVRRAREAFRFMSQARHVGKNVLRLPGAPVERGGTVLITGGTGGLGALLARHLVAEHGVRRLLLASRRGAAAPGASELVSELSALGAEVALAACDVADRAQVQALLEGVPAEHPLSAVVHTAGVLEDGVIGTLTEERVQRVLAPKVAGAWHLHELTEHLDLRAFVLFSSVTGTFGGAGQGNYAAANAFLDALAELRQARGLPASSIAWGLWEQATGMTGHLEAGDSARLARGGLRAISSAEGVRLFDAAQAGGAASIVAAPLDLGALCARARAGALPPLLRGLVRTSPRRAAGASGSL